MRFVPTVLAACLVALASVPPQAHAADLLPVSHSSPTGHVAVSPMGDLTFTARFAVPIRNPYIRVSDSPPGVDGWLGSSVSNGSMTPTVASDGYTWHLPASASVRRAPGTYWWQVVASAQNERGVWISRVAPAQRIDVYVPAAWSKRGPIDRRFGRHGNARFRLSTVGIPQGLSRVRLRTLVAQSARRWGLRLSGWTSRPAGVQDRANVAGFGAVPVAGALAVEEDLFASRYKVFQRCVGGVCGPVQRKFVGRFRTDQDLVIRPDVRWALGPARPSPAEYDLESVLVHEFGHMAGNKKHKSRCTNSPMAGSLAVGEWWRTPHDWYRGGCAPSEPGGLL